MDWELDDEKGIDVVVSPHEGECLIDSIDVAQSSAMPGDTLNITIGVKNIGGTDNLRILVMLRNPSNQVIDTLEKELGIVTGGSTVPTTVNAVIPLDYSYPSINIYVRTYHLGGF